MDREEILRRFEALVDSALTERPPEGIDAAILAAVTEGGDSAQENGRGCDSYGLWTAMTALTQEIKLQGRAFQDLNHALAGHTEKIAEELRAVYAERERTLQREIERRCRKEALSGLIDLRDRLGRGLETARSRQTDIAAAPPRPWWAGIFGKQPVPADPLDALVRGYELGIERLDQELDSFHATEIRCQGESFDARRMNAIDSEESDEVPNGTVLEVYRSGYEWNGEIFRPAQVKVSRTANFRNEAELQ